MKRLGLIAAAVVVGYTVGVVLFVMWFGRFTR